MLLLIRYVHFHFTFSCFILLFYQKHNYFVSSLLYNAETSIIISFLRKSRIVNESSQVNENKPKQTSFE